MIRFFTISLSLCVCVSTRAQVNIITTICGNSTAGYSGDGGPAKNAEINAPESLCLDKYGNIYIADGLNNRIRKIDVSTDIITTVAGGNPVGAFSGDGGPATAAKFRVAEAVFTDTTGNIYIADAGNNRIRKVTIATGILTTVAGSGASGPGSDSGDGGLATNATMDTPTGLCIDKYQNLYIADYANNKIRKVDATTGIITTVAGKGTVHFMGGYAGYSGDGGLAINATFSGTIQVFVDSSENIFICDQWNHAVRKVDASSGIITTIAGTGTAGYAGDGGLAIHAELNQPSGVFVDKYKNIFIAEDGAIKRIDGLTGIMSTVAGNDTMGYSGDNGPATAAKIYGADVFLDSYGKIYIADLDNNRIREVYDSATVAVPEVSTKTLHVYPNPTNNELTVEGVQSPTSYRLLSVTGILFQDGVLYDEKSTLSLQKFPPGVYLLEMTANGYRDIRRVVKN